MPFVSSIIGPDPVYSRFITLSGLGKDIERAVQRTLGAIGIARQAEIDALKAKIAELEAKLGTKADASSGS